MFEPAIRAISKRHKVVKLAGRSTVTNYSKSVWEHPSPSRGGMLIAAVKLAIFCINSDSILSVNPHRIGTLPVRKAL